MTQTKTLETPIRRLKKWIIGANYKAYSQQVDTSNQFIQVSIPDPNSTDYMYRLLLEFDGTGYLLKNIALHKTLIEPNLEKDEKLF